MFAAELRYQTPPVLVKLANITTKKDDTEASFYRMANPTNNIKIGPHLKVSYQAHRLHRPYSLCYLLGYKAL